MGRLIFLQAVLTGAFCAALALVLSLLGTLLSIVPVAIVAFCSGFLGSLSAAFVLGRFK